MFTSTKPDQRSATYPGNIRLTATWFNPPIMLPQLSETGEMVRDEDGIPVLVETQSKVNIQAELLDEDGELFETLTVDVLPSDVAYVLADLGTDLYSSLSEVKEGVQNARAPKHPSRTTPFETQTLRSIEQHREAKRRKEAADKARAEAKNPHPNFATGNTPPHPNQ